MRRALPAAALLAAALPAAAAAAPKAAHWTGVVIAKDAHRGALVTASGNGTVRTLRAGSRVASTRLGQRVQVGGLPLADGTFRLSALKASGTASKLRVRGVVAGFDRAASTYILSAGSSMLTVRASAVRRLSDVSQPLAPGSEVVANATLSGNGALTTPQLSTVGQAQAIELNGILTGISGQQVQLAVVGKGLVTVTVPAGTTLPQLAPGAEVQVAASVAADGSFSLVSVQSDASASSGGPAVNVNGNTGQVDVQGTITAISGNTITLRSGPGASPVTCQLPAGFDTSTLTVGASVTASCLAQGGSLGLTKVEADDQQETTSAEDNGGATAGQGEDEGQSGDDGGSGPIGISGKSLSSLSGSGSSGTSGSGSQSQGGEDANGGGDD